MHAAVITYNLQPGKRDDIIAFADSPDWEAVVSSLHELRGFKRIYSMLHSSSDKGLVVSVYETEADAIAGGESPQVKEAWTKLVDYIDMGSVDRTIYEVVSEG